MPLTTQCPACGARASVPDNAVGQAVRCPRCAQIFTVTEPPPLPDPAAVQPPLPAPRPFGGQPGLPLPVPPPPPNPEIQLRGPARPTGKRSLLPLLTACMAGLALVLSLLALGLVLFSSPLGAGMSKYDFSTPKASFTSHLEMQLNGDVRALIEVNRLLDAPRLKEQLRTLEVRKEADWRGKKILFIAFNEEGAKKHDTVGFEKDTNSGMWGRRYVSWFDVEKDDRNLSRQMRSWQERGDLNPPPEPGGKDDKK